VERARPAVRSDLGRVAELWDIAAAELLTQRGGLLLGASNLTPRPTEDALADMLLRADRHLVVGSYEGLLLGFAVAATEPVTWAGGLAGSAQPALLGQIQVLFVEPPARAVGIGEAMVTLVTEWCSAEGCVGIDAPALPGNRPAKAFFEDQGFTARLLVMHRPLAES
jgi:GNAT superfamily N-acetyltransferase